MPRGLAILASKGALKQSEEIRQAGVRRRAQERAGAEAQAEVIQGKRLLFTAKAGDTDRLYGSVTTAEIAGRLGEEVGFEVDRRKINLKEPIKEIGDHNVPLKLRGELVAQIKLTVVASASDGAAPPAAEAAAPPAAEAAAPPAAEDATE